MKRKQIKVEIEKGCNGRSKKIEDVGGGGDRPTNTATLSYISL